MRPKDASRQSPVASHLSQDSGQESAYVVPKSPDESQKSPSASEASAKEASHQSPVAESEEETFNFVMTDEEKLVYKLLKEKSPVDLNELKAQAGLSNKKWDLALKGLRKHNLATVEKNDEGLFVELV